MKVGDSVDAPVHLQTLADKVKAMAPAERLKLAAGLLERGEYNLARAVIRLVSDELAFLKIVHNR